jgi:hypothetical protein
MSIAVILFGIYHGSSFGGNNPSRNRNYHQIIDVINKNLENFKKKFINTNIDLFLSTNSVNDEQDELFRNTIDFKSFFFDKDNNIELNGYGNEYIDNKYIMGNGYKSRCKKEFNAIELCLNYSKTNNIDYEYFIITRVDLLILKDMCESNINLDFLNIVSECETEPGICDNFYLLPRKYIDDFFSIIKNADEVHHNLKYKFQDNFDINYILNEKKTINDLSFYKLCRT